ncbi:hypothetical protein [Rhodoferax sp.]|uniref:hypothetical protein n=1 Tax=Rhodoferax sp. TaxID=50421 RepID=UPI00374CC532
MNTISPLLQKRMLTGHQAAPEVLFTKLCAAASFNSILLLTAALSAMLPDLRVPPVQMAISPFESSRREGLFI